MNSAVIRKVDCVQLPVADLDDGIAFYGRLGQEVVWRRATAVGLRLPDTDAELVLQTERSDPETDLLVESIDTAVGQFVAAGGSVVVERSTSRSAAAPSSPIPGTTGSSCST